MENKEVKDALNFLCESAMEQIEDYDYEYIDEETLRKYKKPLQELIDKSAKMESYIKQLEQALNKGCEQLEQFDARLVEYHIGDSLEVMTKEEWKEWCKEDDE